MADARGTATGMRDFWDARAGERAHYFVDNRLDYEQPDLDRFWAGGPAALDLMLDRLGAAIQPGDRVVEIGCGVGRITRELARRAGSVRAIDVSPLMLELAREANPSLTNVEWLVGDGRTLPVDDASADVCQSDVVFQHLPSPELTYGYVSEIGRVLVPGGWAAFQVSNEPAIHARPGLRRRLADGLRAAAGRGPGGQHDPAWLGSPVDLEELAAIAGPAGLAVEAIAGAGTQHCHVLVRRTAR